MPTTTIEALAQAKREYEAKVREVARPAIVEKLRGYFEAHPELIAIQWRQYTPYFNDGEPCVFRVSEPEFKWDGDTPEGWRESPREEFCEPCRAWEYNGHRIAASPGFLDPISEGLGSIPEDLYLAAFGDHARVTVTRDGLEVEEYEHE